jgi:manganese/zinc/iron transport system substrate-binding protein
MKHPTYRGWYLTAAVFLGIGLPLLLAGCGANADVPLADRKVRVVTTIGMITDMVQNVGGDRVSVTGLMGPGVDPHGYKATALDMRKMGAADIIFYNGLHLEGKMGEVFEEMGKRVKTVPVTEYVERDGLVRKAPEGYEGSHDPHVWFDVRLWMKAVERVRDALAELDPKHAEVYQANAKKYLAELAQLHEYVKDQAATVPEKQRVLITAHDAFYYFGHAYGFEVHGLQGVSTNAEASVADIRRLADLIVQRRIPVIFAETSVNPKNLEAVQKNVESRGFKVEVYGLDEKRKDQLLFSDAMGNPGTPEGTYVGMIRHNIDTIVKALSREGAKGEGK